MGRGGGGGGNKNENFNMSTNLFKYKKLYELQRFLSLV